MLINSKNLLLLLLYSPGGRSSVCEPIRGATRLIKMFFIFKEEYFHSFKFDKIFDANTLPDFVPDKFGPFSKDIFTDIDFFERLGFIEISTNDSFDVSRAEATEYLNYVNEAYYEDRNHYEERVFSLKPLGKKYIEDKKLYVNLTTNQKDTLINFKRHFNSMPLHAILTYVYNKYPKMAKESIVKHKF